jgi:hypothetical protein
MVVIASTTQQEHLSTRIASDASRFREITIAATVITTAPNSNSSHHHHGLIRTCRSLCTARICTIRATGTTEAMHARTQAPHYPPLGRYFCV